MPYQNSEREMLSVMKWPSSSFFKHPLVVGLILFIVGFVANPIYQYFQTNQNANLKVKGQHYSFQLPILLNDFSSKYSEQITPERLENVATNSGRLGLEQFEPYSFTLYAYLRDLQVVEDIREAQYYNSYWIFSLENKAGRKIENVTLVLPFSGYYEYSSEESETIASGVYENKIDLGDLKPSNVALVRVWSTESAIIIKNKPYFRSSDYPKITFDNGFKPVKF